jgi:hypothetical protein
MISHSIKNKNKIKKEEEEGIYLHVFWEEAS